MDKLAYFLLVVDRFLDPLDETKVFDNLADAEDAMLKLVKDAPLDRRVALCKTIAIGQRIVPDPVVHITRADEA